MSSLALSLILLIAVAIAAALLHNLRQSGWRGWRSRGKAGAAPGGWRDNGLERGEPRLGEESVRVALDSTATAPDGGAARVDEGGARGPSAVQPGDGIGLPHDAPSPAAAVCADSPVAACSGSKPEFDRAPEGLSTTATPIADRCDDAAGEGVVKDPPMEFDSPSAAPSAAGSGRPSADVDMDPGSIPESVSDAGSGSAPDHGFGNGDPVPGQPASASSTGMQAGAPPDVAPGPVLSEAADCVIELVPEAPLSGERLQLIAIRMRRAGSKPIAFDAKPVDGGDFEAPAAGRNYAAVRVGVLLVNRHGALNAMEFSDFTGAVQALAESLPAQAEIPAMGPVLARARELDAICAQLDVQIGINVEAAAAIENAQLAAIARDLELVEQISQRYVRLDARGAVVLFSLAFADVPERVTFLLDVPRVPAALMPFEKMVQAAATCARRLGGSVVDDGGRTLSQASLGQIARQLGQRYESLEAIGLPAGSPLACKVFN